MEKKLQQEINDAKQAAIDAADAALEAAKQTLADEIEKGDRANADALAEAVRKLTAAIDLAEETAAIANAELKMALQAELDATKNDIPSVTAPIVIGIIALVGSAGAITLCVVFKRRRA